MKIEYDVTHLPERKRKSGKLGEATTSLQGFLGTEKKNMVIRCEDDKEAKRTYDTLRNFRNVHKLTEVFELYRSELSIVVIRKRSRKAS